MYPLVGKNALLLQQFIILNNLLISISNYDNGAPVNIENFQDVAKYWSDLKGYVLSLQFSPTSPFRDNASH